MKQTLLFRKWLVGTLCTSVLCLTVALSSAQIAAITPLHAQVPLLDRRVSISMNQTELRLILQRISEMTRIRFTYNSKAIQADRKTVIHVQNERLDIVLKQLLNPLQIEHVVVDDHIILRPVVNAGPSVGQLSDRPSGEVAELAVNGVVTDESGKGLPGVTVVVKGTKQGVTTDADGKFQLTVAVGDETLVFSFVGYNAQEVTLNGRSSLQITLQPGSSALEEVVVVGYGTQKRREVSSAVASISSRDIQNQVTNNALSAMAGQLPGVQITQTTGRVGANPVVRIRGTGSISAGNSPLFVVDGIPLNDAGDFNLINPGDIETIDVLKDAASAAIYGSRGGNGVVMVTTKKGHSGKARINFDYYTGIQQVSKKIDLLNRDEHIDLVKEAIDANWVLAGGSPGVPNGSRSINNVSRGYNYPTIYDTDPNSLPDTDWQDEIYRNAGISNYQISAQGGGERMRYYVSGNYFDQKGVVRRTDYKRYAARANMDLTLSDKVRAGIGFAPSYSTENQQTTDGHWQEGIVLSALGMPPTVQARYPNGLYGQVLGNTEWTNTSYISLMYSPLPYLDDPNFRNRQETVRMLGNTYLEWEPLKHLVLRTSFNTDIRSGWYNYYRPSTVSITNSPVLTPGSPGPNIANIGSNHSEARSLNYAWDNTLTYNRTFATNHALTVLAGYSVQKNTTENATVTGQTGTFDNDLITYVSAANIRNGTAGKSYWSLLSYLARVNYAFKDRYFLTAAIRRDGSSRFATNNKWALFPSVSAAWRLSDEPFMQANWLSELKLRVSYGVTGNFNIGDFAYYALMAKDNYSFGTGSGNLVGGLAAGNLGNPNLSWETNSQLDAGIDLGLWQNRITLNADYYNRVTDGLLYSTPVPGASGFGSVLTNIGKVRNRGVEFGITAVILNKPQGLRWTASQVFSHNKNTILQLGTNNEPIRETSENTVTQISQVGGSFGEFYGYKVTGIFRDQADVDANAQSKFTAAARPGDPKFQDTDGDGAITPADRMVLGNPNPDFTWGQTHKFAFRGFDLDVQFQGVSGGKIVYLASRFFGFNNPSYVNLGVSRDRWRSPEDLGDGKTPRAYTPNAIPAGNVESLTDRFMYDASYLRLRNVTLAYNFPKHWIEKWPVKSVRLYASGQNLFTISKYIGYNPEVSQEAENIRKPGLDYGVYPLARTVTMGINFGF